MNSLVLTAILIVAIASLVRLLAVRLGRGVHARNGCDPEAFDISRYRPMERLLGGEDLEFLAETPGVGKDAVRQLRQERRQLFFRYLANLEADFAGIHGAARALLLCAEEDRSEFAAALVAQQVAFRRSVLMIRLRMAIPGFAVAASEVAKLLEAANAMGAATARLTAATEP